MMFRDIVILSFGVQFFVASLCSVFAQEFQREIATIPVFVDAKPVAQPFAGGISQSKPTLADIDNDGDLDLFIGESDLFGSFGGGAITFYRNTGSALNPVFEFETKSFSDIDVRGGSAPSFVDIDKDEDLDLFVGNAFGRLYFFRNLGSVTNPQFALETDNFENIRVGEGYLPFFADIDDDGDSDLFVGERSGNIYFYRNIGARPDSGFVLEAENFAEIDVGEESAPTFVDIDNDGDLDLFVGEGRLSGQAFVNRGNINFYRNIGNRSNPEFSLVTEDFAFIKVIDESTPVFADIDNDGDQDLFVGDFRGNINFYQNTGDTTVIPIFSLESNRFADIMVDNNSHPVFADIDNDDDQDLFVGEIFGNIHFYRNAGSATSHDFVLETENFADIDVFTSSFPVFADIDADGDLDLFIGEGFGNINFYRNNGTAEAPTFEVEAENFENILVRSNAKPAFADIDSDGDLDLFVGEDNGRLHFYQNDGTAENPDLNLITENFVAIHGGLSKPAFADVDGDSDLDLFVGESFGNINFYRNNGSATNPVFTFVTDDFADVDVEFGSAPEFADIDDDGDLDLFVGGEEGGTVVFYRRTDTNFEPSFTLLARNYTALDVGHDSAPTFADIDDDDDLDLLVGKSDGTIDFYRNIGSVTNPSFFLETRIFGNISGDAMRAATFADIDDDGDLDLFIGSFSGFIILYQNIGTAANSEFVFTPLFPAIDIGGISRPALADIDNDGDFDLFVGDGQGNLNFFRNTGTRKAAAFTFETGSFAEIDVGTENAPYFVDIDSDADLDLFAGSSDGKIYFYRNVGSDTLAVFNLETENFSEIDIGDRSIPAFNDIDGDGDLDLFVGEFDGGLHFFRNNMVTGISSPDKLIPEVFQLSQNYPNPFNPGTNIEYQLPLKTEVQLTIFNILGQRVAELVHEVQESGIYTAQWDGRDSAGRHVASGMYLYKLETSRFVQVKKLLLMR